LVRLFAFSRWLYQAGQLDSVYRQMIPAADFINLFNADAALPAQSVRERANLLFRKLADAGWFVQEQHYDYTFKVSVPDYALAMLETLEKICSGYRMEFRGRVLSIYQNLTGEEGLSYVALQQAAEYTAELIDGLKRLGHSIKGYTEKK